MVARLVCQGALAGAELGSFGWVGDGWRFSDFVSGLALGFSLTAAAVGRGMAV